MKQNTKERMQLLAEIIYLREINRLLLETIKGIGDTNDDRGEDTKKN